MSRLTIGLVAPAGSSTATHTGSWRTERPKFLWTACTACDLCVKFCPEGIVFRTGEKSYGYDLNYCKGCGICAAECPVNDIEMVRETP
jgi:pyruvate ferredoxin oxidoreductase delta subunit